MLVQKTSLTRGPNRPPLVQKTSLTRGPNRPFRCLDKTLLTSQLLENQKGHINQRGYKPKKKSEGDVCRGRNWSKNFRFYKL